MKNEMKIRLFASVLKNLKINNMTGYTEGVLNGRIDNFPAFAKQCMRSFMPLIHMREEPLDKEYEPRKPSDYHYDKIKEIEAKLDKLSRKRNATMVKEQKRFALSMVKQSEEAIIRTQASKKRVLKLLNKANAWQPPTKEHVSFKGFMVEQLQGALDDCDTKFYDSQLIAFQKEADEADGVDWRKMLHRQYTDELEQAKKSLDEELVRCGDSVSWVDDVLKTLN